MSDARIEKSYEIARETYAEQGVDTDAALAALAGVAISLHSWQGDDVTGWEVHDEATSLGGTAPIGTYPGKARTPAELRADIAMALSCVPGRHRVNLQSHYYETDGRKIGRDEIEAKHYHGWRDWAKEQGLLGIDIAPAYYSHPMFKDGMSLSHPDKSVRDYWIEHGRRCRRAIAELAREFGTPSLVNYWMPDGFKDMTIDRSAPRRRLAAALDDTMAEPIPSDLIVDAVESKLFGLGSESYVVGSHEFHMGYAMTRRKTITIDTGHFHPTEFIADKVSSLLLYSDRLSFHISRGVRWDSDHVVIFNDESQAIAQELVRGGFLNRTHIGLDYFDASINRVAAWVVGMRSFQKALLVAMLEPLAKWRAAEVSFDFTSRLAWLEEAKAMPWAAVWDKFCLVHEVPVGGSWLPLVKEYEERVMSLR